jgi:hypothetical protein
MQEYYTYAYLRENRTPYYIGKGKKNRIYSNNGKPCCVPKDKKRIIFLKQNLTEQDAFKHEIYMIFIFKRKCDGGILRNKSLGGEGTSGVSVTEQTKQKLREWNKKNNTIPPLNKGKKWWNNGFENKMTFNCPGDGWVLGRLEFNKGHIVTIETKNKISLKNLGKKRSEEFKLYMKQINLGKRWWTDGVKNKRSVECPGIEWKIGRTIKPYKKEIQDEMERKSKSLNDDSTTD